LEDVKDPTLLDHRLTDGGKHPPHFTPQKHYYTQADNNKKVGTLNFTMFKSKYLALCWRSISGVRTYCHWRRLNAQLHKYMYFGHVNPTFQFTNMCTLTTSTLPFTAQIRALRPLKFKKRQPVRIVSKLGTFTTF
jgi:hypothetical protein